MNRKEFIDMTIGTALGMGYGYGAGRIIEPRVGMQHIEKYAGKPKPSEHQELQNKLAQASQEPALVDGIAFASLGAVAGDLVAIKNQKGHSRRDFWDQLARIVVSGAAAGPLTAYLRTETIPHYIQEQRESSNKPLRPQQVIDAIKKQNRDYSKNSIFFGLIASLVAVVATGFQSMVGLERRS